MNINGIPEGVLADLPTPFEEDGAVDWFALGRILENCRLHGLRRFLVGGNIETDGLSPKEKRGVLEDAVTAAGKRGCVIAVLSDREGARAAEIAEDAAYSGASALLLRLTPGLPAAGGLRLLRAIAGASGLPVFLAARERSFAECLALTNDPACGFFEECASVSDKFFLSEFARGREGAAVCAVGAGGQTPVGAGKGDAALVRCSLPFGLFAPDEESLALAPAVAYTGVRSRLAAVCPEAALRLWRARRSSAPDEGSRRALALSRAFEGDKGLPALKWALYRKGLCTPALRLPLCAPDESVKRAIDEALETLGF